jgi:hypothetical protein
VRFSPLQRYDDPVSRTQKVRYGRNDTSTAEAAAAAAAASGSMVGLIDGFHTGITGYWCDEKRCGAVLK